MSNPPDNPKIYHITHVNNLSLIARAGGLWSHRKVDEREPGKTLVGMSQIKARRLNEIEVSCHAGTKIGEYVPFYFCPRSVMLYLLYMSNHANLEYRGGQTPIVHLQADLHAVVNWADEHDVRWALTTGNAGAYYVECYNSLADLRKINWEAVRATDWREPAVKEGEQAEFLLYDSLPFELVEEIGVINASVQSTALTALAGLAYQPVVSVRRNWYY